MTTSSNNKTTSSTNTNSSHDGSGGGVSSGGSSGGGIRSFFRRHGRKQQQQQRPSAVGAGGASTMRQQHPPHQQQNHVRSENNNNIGGGGGAPPSNGGNGDAGGDCDPVPPTTVLMKSVSRKSIHRKTPSLSTYQTTPITKHYEINNQILMAFESKYEQRSYKIAYAIGLQFVETALHEIPKHGDYHAKRHETERINSSLNAARVTQILYEIQQNGQLEDDDVEPAQQLQHGNICSSSNNNNNTAPPKKTTNFGDSEAKRLQQLKALARQQVKQALIDQASYEAERRKTIEQLRNLPEPITNSWVVCEPLMACSEKHVASAATSSDAIPSDRQYSNTAAAAAAAAADAKLDHRMKPARAPQPAFSDDREAPTRKPLP